MLCRIATEVPGFVRASKNYIHDLMFFSKDKGCQARLESTGDPYFIGEPYFPAEIRGQVLSLPTFKGPLSEALDALHRKRAGTSISAAHDLAPLIAPSSI